MNTTMNEVKKDSNVNLKNNNTNSANGMVDKNVNGAGVREFFSDQLKDIYWAEQKLVKTVPKLKDAATSKELKDLFTMHLDQTTQQVQRLESIFKTMNLKAEAVKCQAMAGIVDEGQEILQKNDRSAAQRDIALIFIGQKANHYKLATYNSLLNLARTLDMKEVSDHLTKTLNEEKEVDKKLIQLISKVAGKQAAGKENREPTMA